MIPATAHQRISRLAALREVHAAFGWMHLQEKRLMQWQRTLVQIPAPPFGEAARAAWMLERMQEMGLAATQIDSEGNALGYLRTPVAGEPCVLLSAHIDTVFPASIPIDLIEEGSVLRAPGACDNAAGVTGLLAIIAAMRHAEIAPACNILFAANVGEEAEGNLRGMRYLFSPAHGRHIAFAIVLEGSGTQTVVTQALGSRRFRVELRGPGGHAWSDAGSLNPAVVLAQAITRLYEIQRPASPRTAINVGVLQSGSSITAIPEEASALFDLRSVDATELLRCEVALFRAVEDAVLEANASHAAHRQLRFKIESIGERPAAILEDDSPLLKTIRAVDRHLNLRTGERTGSTDANLPLSLGVQAAAMGAGGTSGGIHTRNEWYDATGRELALRRVLLTLLDCCERTAEAEL